MKTSKAEFDCNYSGLLVAYGGTVCIPEKLLWATVGSEWSEVC